MYSLIINNNKAYTYKMDLNGILNIPLKLLNLRSQYDKKVFCKGIAPFIYNQYNI